jgi:hypothetical protein
LLLVFSSVKTRDPVLSLLRLSCNENCVTSWKRSFELTAWFCPCFIASQCKLTTFCQLYNYVVADRNMFISNGLGRLWQISDEFIFNIVSVIWLIHGFLMTVF